MIAIPQRHIGLAVLVLSLALSLPAFAQKTPSTSPQQHTTNGSGANNSDQNGFRRDIEQIRKEHDDIETAIDALLDKCINVTTQQAEECQKEKAALHERRAKLNDRRQALHDKMIAVMHRSAGSTGTSSKP